MNNNQTIPSMKEYNQKAKEIMDRVAGEQPQEVKKRVEAVRETVGKTVTPAPDAAS